MLPGFIARFAGVAQDAWLERAFDLPMVERMVFGALAGRFDPRAAGGFEGRVVYELERPATGGHCSRWTVQIINGRAVVRPEDRGEAAAVLRMPVADFVRVAAGLIDPAEPVLKGRARAQGDLGVVARLPEMFGAPTPV